MGAFRKDQESGGGAVLSVEFERSISTPVGRGRSLQLVTGGRAGDEVLVLLIADRGQVEVGGIRSLDVFVRSHATPQHRSSSIPYRPGHGPTVINDQKLAAKNDSIRSARQAYQLWSQPLIADVAREVQERPDRSGP